MNGAGDTIKKLVEQTGKGERSWKMRGESYGSAVETRVGGMLVIATAEGEVIVNDLGGGNYPLEDYPQGMGRDLYTFAREEAWEDRPKSDVLDELNEKLDA